MRKIELYLRDILDASESIERFLQDVEEPQFLRDELIQSAVLFKLVTIGEAAAFIRNHHPDLAPHIDWATVVRFRNVVVHSYFGVDWSIVWSTAIQDVPELFTQVKNLLDNLPPADFSQP